MKKKNIAIFGAGRFSSFLIQQLSRFPRYKIVLIEKDEIKARALSDYVEEIYIGDATDETFLTKLHLKNIDIFVVGIGDNIQNSILICSILQEKYDSLIIAKAVDLRHEEVLRKIGIKEIINLQTNAARVALLKIINPILGSLDRKNLIELDEEISFIRTKISDNWKNRTVQEINLPQTISIVLVQRDKKNLIVSGHTILKEEDNLIILGRNEELNKLIKDYF